MSLTSIAGVRCKVVGIGLFKDDRVISISRRVFEVNKESIKFIQGRVEQAYVISIDVKKVTGTDRYLARINSQGECVKIWVDEGKLVYS